MWCGIVVTKIELIWYDIVVTKIVSTKTVPIKTNTTKTITKNLNKKKYSVKIEYSYILLAFSLVTTSLLLVISTYCYLIKHRSKRNRFLPY